MAVDRLLFARSPNRGLRFGRPHGNHGPPRGDRVPACYREAEVYTAGGEPYSATTPVNQHRPGRRSAGRTLEQGLTPTPGALYLKNLGLFQIDPDA